MAATIDAARNYGKKVLADPIRGGAYVKYAGCSVITPNRLEAGLAANIDITNNATALLAGERLLHQLDLEAAIVTLDKDGMALIDRSGTRVVYATRPRQVYDITGAGDMVLSVLGLAVAAGADYGTAIRLANIAGGLEVEKIGVATVTRDEIRADLAHSDLANRSRNNKVLKLEELMQEVAARRRLGHKVAFTNGCFDVLHAGHVQYLTEAREQADLLIVGVNSDASVRGLKGPTRPINPQAARVAVMAGLQSVDYITVFETETPRQLIEALRPDVLVKGADYRKDEVVGADFVESYGGRVHLAAVRDGFSTTQLLQQLRAA
jgi:D-beta-D-heptose 7-phosphate kinase/D-beta-D-heptose 1-phosphate adenosyltransferase